MKAIIVSLFSVVLSLMLISCAAHSFTNLDNLKEELKLKDFPGQSDYPEEDALVLTELHDENIILNSDYKFETVKRIHRLIKLFRNLEEFSDMEIPIPSGDRLLNLTARVVKPDGKIVELKNEDYHTITGNEDDYKFYDNQKTIKFVFPSLEKNCIIEYDYSIDEQYPFVMDVWSIGARIPKLRSTFKLTTPYLLLMSKNDGGAGWGWKYRDYNIRVPDPKLQKNSSDNVTDKSVSFTWEKTNIPAFKPDPKMSAHDDFLSYVKFAPIDWKTWDNVSDWYYTKIFKPHLDITDTIINKSKEITKNCSDEIEKITSINSFIQTLRTVDIELGKVSITPGDPQKTLQRKYGDGKDKCILLVSMLKSLGIKASPVLVLTRDEGLIDKTFPCWNFNHMIVKVTTKDKQDIWIDPSLKYCKAGFLTYNCENINVLVLNDDGTSQIELTPKSSPKENAEQLFVKLDYTNSDSVMIDISAKYKGEYNFYIKNELSEKTPKEMMKYCKSLISDKYLNAEIINYSVSNLDSVNEDLKLNFSAKVPNTITSQSDLLFLNADPLKLSGDWDWLGREKRTYDIDFDYLYTLNKTIEIFLPENKYNVKEIPSKVAGTEQGIIYLRDFNAYGNSRIVANERFSITQKKIKVENYKKVRDFIDNVKSKMNEQIILTTK